MRAKQSGAQPIRRKYGLKRRFVRLSRKAQSFAAHAKNVELSMMSMVPLWMATIVVIGVPRTCLGSVGDTTKPSIAG
jgi:hypothetical protein